MTTGDKAKDFLTSVINLEDGTVNLENASDAYEAWVTIKPNYDVNLLKHISDTPNELVQQEIHLNTWVIERGMARRNSIEADQCREPEQIAWAEEVAQKNKLGIWNE